MLVNPSSSMQRRDEMKIKVERCRRYLKQRGAAGLLFTDTAHVAWLTGGAETHVVFASTVSFGPLLVTDQGIYLCCTNIETDRMLNEEFQGLDIERADTLWYEPTQAQLWMESIRGGKPILKDTESETAAWLTEQQLVMNENEIARYRLIGSAAGECLHQTCHSIEPGWTEMDVAGELSRRCHQAGLWPMLVLVAADERIERYRHPIPTRKTIERYVMVVLCARRWGLISNQTRLVHFGPVPHVLQQKHDAAMKVDATLCLATRPGRTYGEIFQRGQAAYREYGFEHEWTLHHQGGPTGYQGRYFLANGFSSQLVQAGHVVAWNPSITGTKSEDTILVQENGIEVLSAARDWPARSIEVSEGKLERYDILVK